MTRGASIAEARECLGCGELFIARRWNQTRHAPNCRRDPRDRHSAQKNAARNRRAAAPTRFIGVDGEGVTLDDGTHLYVLLSAGDAYLEARGKHLDFSQILAFLWSNWDREAAYVGFYLSYDWAQWLRTLPVREALRLFYPRGLKVEDMHKGLGQTHDIPDRRRRAQKDGPKYKKGELIDRAQPIPVDYKGWEFDYLPGKRFRFRLAVPKKKGQRLPTSQTKYLNICDAGPFFQTSFLKAIDPAVDRDPVITPAEFDTIKRGKERRATAVFDPEMVAYNALECEVLARLMHRHDIGIRAAGLRLKKSEWFGPGQVAEKWLAREAAPRGAQVREVAPDPVLDAARSSYFGGWFEIFWHGLYPGRSHAYDLNSAYPYVMASLPCLLHGTWEHADHPRGLRLTRAARRDLGGLGVCLLRAEVTGSDPVCGAMQHRTEKRTVLRPHRTAGWYWASELAAAYDAGLVDEVTVFESWLYHPCQRGCAPPLGGLGDLYRQRLEIGKNTPAGKAFKLIYNSAYGKICQSVGEPKWSNPLYASLITSGCRTLITRAIASHPTGTRSLLMIATDGIVFGEPHPALDLDPERLGAWDEKTHDNLSMFLPGKYWDDSARAKIAAGEAPVFRSRGIPAKDFARHIPTVDRQWTLFAQNGWPRLWLPVSFQLVTPKQAIARGDWSLCGTVVKNKRRLISSDPVDKRVATGPGRSRPYSVTDKLVSTGYDGLFGDELREQAAIAWGDHPEGDIEDLMAEMFYDR